MRAVIHAYNSGPWLYTNNCLPISGISLYCMRFSFLLFYVNCCDCWQCLKKFQIRDCIVHFVYLCMIYAFIIETVIQFKPFHKLD